ncbi:hypothetical protein HNQ94_003790 [Salirhabdus euzebyi]|uniref:Uncharacterized protein n=1 Tax=Salirhabdus euzebyi TaxID=394506 RepID=A0A841QA49_9BACI|nr:hypothetical protein [Salirhabdus euzebyi]MBB6455290.1 hypothetical protein [Salirhabdus euzebyi]
MEVKAFVGYQLEKSVPTSPEDSFVRSEVAYFDEGKEKEFHLVYLDYFHTKIETFSPYIEDPIFNIGEKGVFFKDIASLAALVSNPELKQQKRVYVHDLEDFEALFEQTDWEKVQKLTMTISQKTPKLKSES